MTDEHYEPKPSGESRSSGAGMGKIGTAVGIVPFAATGQAFWMAIGPGMGVALGAALSGDDD
jgi:hypothetical protein